MTNDACSEMTTCKSIRSQHRPSFVTFLEVCQANPQHLPHACMASPPPCPGRRQPATTTLSYQQPTLADHTIPRETSTLPTKPQIYVTTPDQDQHTLHLLPSRRPILKPTRWPPPSCPPSLRDLHPTYYCTVTAIPYVSPVIPMRETLLHIPYPWE